jgi:hypothetical protein
VVKGEGLMTCDILDFRCMLVNEVIGNVFLASILFAIAYFIVASKMKLGFDTTFALAIPIILTFGLAVSGFQIMYVLLTLVAGVMLALAFLRLIGNR